MDFSSIWKHFNWLQWASIIWFWEYGVEKKLCFKLWSFFCFIVNFQYPWLSYTSDNRLFVESLLGYHALWWGDCFCCLKFQLLGVISIHYCCFLTNHRTSHFSIHAVFQKAFCFQVRPFSFWIWLRCNRICWQINKYACIQWLIWPPKVFACRSINMWRKAEHFFQTLSNITRIYFNLPTPLWKLIVVVDGVSVMDKSKSSW